MAITANAMSSIPYTQQLAFFNANTRMSWTPKTLEEWTQQQEDNGREQIVDEDYITEYIDRVKGFDILVYKGRELSVELWPLTVGSAPLLVYKGHRAEWIIDDMETTYESLDKLIGVETQSESDSYFAGKKIRNFQMEEFAKVKLDHLVTGVKIRTKTKEYVVRDLEKSTASSLTPEDALKIIQRYVQKKQSGASDRTIKPCITAIHFP